MFDRGRHQSRGNISESNFRGVHISLLFLRGLNWLNEQHFQITNGLKLLYISSSWILQIHHPKINEKNRAEKVFLGIFLFH